MKFDSRPVDDDRRSRNSQGPDDPGGRGGDDPHRVLRVVDLGLAAHRAGPGAGRGLGLDGHGSPSWAVKAPPGNVSRSRAAA